MRSLANLFAQREPDPGARQALVNALERTAGVEVSTHGTWVLAREALGVGERCPPRSIAFAEGQSCWIRRPEMEPDWHGAKDVLTGRIDRLSRMPGDFTIFAIDSHDALWVARSVAGVTPLYVWADAERPAASTRLRELVRWSVTRPSPDVEAIAFHSAARQFPGESSPVVGVRALPPGTRACSATGFRSERYWEHSTVPQVRPSRRALAEHAERLRALLFRELERGLSEGGNMLTLSGGVDSSVLAVLACRRFGRDLSTLTFLSAAAEQRARDQIQIERVLREIAGRHEGHTERILDADLRLELARQAPPSLVPTSHPALAMLHGMAAERPIHTYLGGEFADMLVGSLTHDDDWISSTAFSDLAAYPQRIPYVVTRAGDWWKLRVRRRFGILRPPIPPTLPRYFARALGHAYHAWYRYLCEQFAVGERPYLRQRLERGAWIVAQNWEVTSTLGIARRFPFFSRDQLELALSHHPLIHAGRGSKQALRLGLRGEVPDWVLARADKGLAGSPRARQVAWDRESAQEIADFLAPEWLCRSPQTVDGMTALRLQEVLNIVRALRNEGQYRERLGHGPTRGFCGNR